MRRRRFARRSKTSRIIVFILLTFLFVFWRQPRVFSPTASSSSNWIFNWNKKVESVVAASQRVVIRTDDQFVQLALGLVEYDLQQEERTMISTVKKSGNKMVFRCALNSKQMLQDCSSSLRSVYRKLIKDGEKKVKFMLPSVMRCQDKERDSDGLPNATADFLSGVSISIIEKLPKQIKKMGNNVKGNGREFPSFDDILARTMMIDKELCKEVWSGTVNVSRALSAEFSDVQIVSTSYLLRNTSLLLKDVITTMVGSATTTYLLLDHMIEVPHDNKTTMDIMEEITKKGCGYTPLIGNIDYKWDDEVVVDFPFVLRIHCPNTLQMIKSSNHISSPYWYDDLIPLESKASPVLCEHFSEPVELSRIIKFGAKTAIMRGLWRGKDVIVKVLHPYQYFLFEGFNTFMREEKIRSPLIHYPILSCYSNTYSAIFQIQTFLRGYKSLELFAPMRRNITALSLRQRAEIGMQILCIFNFLHTQHPNGFFVYDDNHAGQYLIKGDSKGFFSVRLIDIDTLQLGSAQSTFNSSYPYSNYSTRCRCFYCHGRSNCLFFNTYEGYQGCGQLRNNIAWNLEIPRLVRDGRRCHGSSDIWFEAQLLYLLLDGSVAWRRLQRAELIERIEMEDVPTLRAKGMAREHSELVNLLLSRMFTSRPTEAVVLEDLKELCKRLKCRPAALKCPSLVSSKTGSYSSPLNLFLR
ncbi:hypothetical protein LSM04_009261 [Trypanosoma melophagium]|uniref:uncharacterized protein n=1 Tax=Trypanosoma melophagium TaxID=715481 RepID=UPI00351A4409|nr:hypothetical protein LSM04_009261 [Trypanosoma melophagium]